VLHALGWRPFPVDAAAKTPSITGWNLLCQPEGRMTDDELTELIRDCGEDACSLAVTPDLFVADIDEERPDAAARLAALADDHLGVTPLVRQGHPSRPPLRVYRQAVPGSIRTRRSFRLDLLGAGGAQFVAFGLHKSGRPYQWTGPASPVTLRPNDPAIPAVTRDQAVAFAAEAGRIIGPRPPAHGAARRLGRPSSSIALDGPLVRLKRLIPLHGFHGAAAYVLADVQEGERNETAFAVISSALGRGLDEAEIMDLFDRHFAGWAGVSGAQVESMLARLLALEAARPPRTTRCSLRAGSRRSRPGASTHAR
jgi:hypothetical protein